MKRIITLAFLSAISLASFAQSKAGTWSVIPHVGVSIASLTHQSGGIEVGDNQSQELKPQARPGFTGGVDVMYQVSDNVGLSLGLSYVQAGCKYKDVDDNGVTWHDHYARTDYISVPLVAHSYIAPGLSINVGVAPSFLIYGWMSAVLTWTAYRTKRLEMSIFLHLVINGMSILMLILLTILIKVVGIDAFQ